MPPERKRRPANTERREGELGTDMGRTWTDFELVKVSSQEELSAEGCKGNPQDLSNQQVIEGKWM